MGMGRLRGLRNGPEQVAVTDFDIPSLKTNPLFFLGVYENTDVKLPQLVLRAVGAETIINPCTKGSC